MRVALFQPDIAQNVGAVMRLCACFRVALDIIEPCGFPLTAKALRRTAMDYAAHCELRQRPSWDAYVQHADQAGGRLILFTTQGATALWRFQFAPDDHLVFGRESAGAPDFVHARADARVVIPIAPEARAMNLATAAAVALAEATRQLAPDWSDAPAPATK
ncbi:MAG: TrmH family RNA methyltransferase [Maricaulaceae bacterium]